MATSKKLTPKRMITRRRPRQAESIFVMTSFSLPKTLAKLIEKGAMDDYGGNKSALATEALARFFDVDAEALMTRE